LPSRSADENAKIFNKLSAIAVATLRETDPVSSSIRRKQPSRACADGRPAGPLIGYCGLAWRVTEPMRLTRSRRHEPVRGAAVWYVYFLELATGDIYLGSTDDLKRHIAPIRSDK
jgi:hypothetical protein